MRVCRICAQPRRRLHPLVTTRFRTAAVFRAARREDQRYSQRERMRARPTGRDCALAHQSPRMRARLAAGGGAGGQEGRAPPSSEEVSARCDTRRRAPRDVVRVGSRACRPRSQKRAPRRRRRQAPRGRPQRGDRGLPKPPASPHRATRPDGDAPARRPQRHAPMARAHMAAAAPAEERSPKAQMPTGSPRSEALRCHMPPSPRRGSRTTTHAPSSS